MSIRNAIQAAQSYREEIIFGSLTGLLSSTDAPSPVVLPRLAQPLRQAPFTTAPGENHSAPIPLTATSFTQSIPQDIPALLHLVDQLENQVDDSGEFSYATGQLLYGLGAAFRRHGLRPEHYSTLAQAITSTIQRYLDPNTHTARILPPSGTTQTSAQQAASPADITTLCNAAELACSILAQGCEEATHSEASYAQLGHHINPATVQARVVDVELRTPHIKVVRLHMNPPLMFAVGEPILARTPYTPKMWRPVFSALPCNPDGLIELHISDDPTQLPAAHQPSAAGTACFASAIVNYARTGDEWVLSPQPAQATELTRGLRAEDPRYQLGHNGTVILLAEGTGLAAARAAVLQQVFGSFLGATPQTAGAATARAGSGRSEATAGSGIGTGIVGEMPGTGLVGAGDTTGLGADPQQQAQQPRTTRPMHLFWGAQQSDQLYELQGLLGLARGCDWLRITPVVNKLTSTGDPHYHSMLVEGDVLDIALSSSRYLREKTFIASGRSSFTQAVAHALIDNHDVPATQVVELPTDTDFYTPSASSTPSTNLSAWALN